MGICICDLVLRFGIRTVIGDWRLVLKNFNGGIKIGYYDDWDDWELKIRVWYWGLGLGLEKRDWNLEIGICDWGMG